MKSKKPLFSSMIIISGVLWLVSGGLLGLKVLDANSILTFEQVGNTLVSVISKDVEVIGPESIENQEDTKEESKDAETSKELEGEVKQVEIGVVDKDTGELYISEGLKLTAAKSYKMGEPKRVTIKSDIINESDKKYNYVELTYNLKNNGIYGGKVIVTEYDILPGETREFETIANLLNKAENITYTVEWLFMEAQVHEEGA